MSDPLDHLREIREVLARLNERRPHWKATVYVFEPDESDYPPLSYSATIEQEFDDGLCVEIEHSRKTGGGWWASIDIKQRREKYDGIDVWKTDGVFHALFGSDHAEHLAYSELAAFIHEATAVLAKSKANSIRQARAAFFGRARRES